MASQFVTMVMGILARWCSGDPAAWYPEEAWNRADPGACPSQLAVDATGVGAPVVEMLGAAGLASVMTAVTITGGAQAHRNVPVERAAEGFVDWAGSAARKGRADDFPQDRGSGAAGVGTHEHEGSSRREPRTRRVSYGSGIGVLAGARGEERIWNAAATGI